MDFDGFLSGTIQYGQKTLGANILSISNWKAGDTNIYPARMEHLVTLRYKNLKQGIEDFELIKMSRPPQSQRL